MLTSKIIHCLMPLLLFRLLSICSYTHPSSLRCPSKCLSKCYIMTDYLHMRKNYMEGTISFLFCTFYFIFLLLSLSSKVLLCIELFHPLLPYRSLLTFVHYFSKSASLFFFTRYPFPLYLYVHTYFFRVFHFTFFFIFFIHNFSPFTFSKSSTFNM